MWWLTSSSEIRGDNSKKRIIFSLIVKLLKLNMTQEKHQNRQNVFFLFVMTHEKNSIKKIYFNS